MKVDQQDRSNKHLPTINDTCRPIGAAHKHKKAEWALPLRMELIIDISDGIVGVQHHITVVLSHEIRRGSRRCIKRWTTQNGNCNSRPVIIYSLNNIEIFSYVGQEDD